MYGEFLVVGKRHYRGHAPGTRFEARIQRAAVSRAIARGDIELLRYTTPAIVGDFIFPHGWLPPPGRSEQGAGQRGAERRLTR